jgi:hypothetical protein
LEAAQVRRIIAALDEKCRDVEFLNPPRKNDVKPQSGLVTPGFYFRRGK